MRSPQHFQISVKLYVAAVAACAAAAAWWAVQGPVALGAGSFAATLALAFLAAMRSVKIPALRAEFTTSDPFIFFALAAGGPEAALWTALASVAGAAARAPRSIHPLRLTFNASALALAAVGGAAGFRALGGRPADSISGMLLPLTGAVALHFIVNTALVAAVVALRSRGSWAKIWLSGYVWTLVPSAASLGLAVALLAVPAQQWAWLAVLGLPPALVFAGAYKQKAKDLQEQGRTLVPSEAQG